MVAFGVSLRRVSDARTMAEVDCMLAPELDNYIVHIVHQVVHLADVREDDGVPTERPGYELPFLLIGAFRALVDQLHAELAMRGHPNARPLHGFALQAVGDGLTVSELGRRLGVTKQAAAKTASGLERLGYVARTRDPSDGRAWRVRRTPRGDELLALSAELFARARAGWVDELGARRVADLEDALESIGGPSRWGDIPGWIR
jgi:DNA-binding MarR family transcriptional regulator